MELQDTFAVCSPALEAVMRSTRIIWDELLYDMWEMQLDCAIYYLVAAISVAHFTKTE
jgi:hypothetical protein